MASEESAARAIPDWRDPASYAYTHDLTRDAWAWEFLRRNPKYRSVWKKHLRSGGTATSPPADSPARFGVVLLEDPNRTALAATVLWRPEISSFVLPLRTEPGRSVPNGAPLDLTGFRDRAAAETNDGWAQHILFLEAGRRLQIAVRGGQLFGHVHLLTDASLGPRTFKRRVSMLERLGDFIAHGQLAPRLYPSEPRGRRLAVILQALDGWLGKASQRAIGQAIFGQAEVDRDWRDCDSPLRDRVRLTIRRGHCLMQSGYLALLR